MTNNKNNEVSSETSFIDTRAERAMDNTRGRKCTGREASRHKRLLQTIRSLELHPPKPVLSCIYMFYNGDDGQNRITELDYEQHMIKQH